MPCAHEQTATKQHSMLGNLTILLLLMYGPAESRTASDRSECVHTGPIGAGCVTQSSSARLDKLIVIFLAYRRLDRKQGSHTVGLSASAYHVYMGRSQCDTAAQN